jgi:hypothetical protein
VGLVEALLAECFVGLQDPQLLWLGFIAHVGATAGFVDPVGAQVRGSRLVRCVLSVIHSR